MTLETIPALRLDASGVTFRYLCLRIKSRGQQKQIVRGLAAFAAENADDQLMEQIERELDDLGLESTSRQIDVQGGGTVTVNPYEETLALYGASPRYGAEPHREGVARQLEEAFQGFRVSWHPSADAGPSSSNGSSSSP